MMTRAAAFFLVFFVLVGCQRLGSGAVPEELIGVWGTSEPRYADCTFEIKKGMIIFENGSDPANVNLIRKIEKRIEGGKTLYRIHYEDGNKLDYKLSLFYSQIKNREVIHLSNQKEMEWTRVGLPRKSRG